MRRLLMWALVPFMAVSGGPGLPGGGAGRAAGAQGAPDVAALAEQVRASERAFAKSMADRSLDAFASHVAADAIFFGRAPLRGKDAVVGAWRRFFDGPDAPFSWEPELVEVLDSGTLALSSGPVRDPQGNQIGVFNSIWRLEADGAWRVVFDKGSDYCPPPGATKAEEPKPSGKKE